MATDKSSAAASEGTPAGPDAIVALTLVMVRQATALAAGLAAAGGLHPSDLTALRALDAIGAGGRVRVGELGQELALSSAATTGLLDRLERADLAIRLPDPDDRRRVLVELTPRALAFGAEYLAPYRRAAVAASRAVPAAHRASVHAFLKAVVTAGGELAAPRA